MSMLVERIRDSEEFKELSMDEQIIRLKLAEAFEKDPVNLYRTPVELQAATGIGNREQWTQFLGLEIVRQYIRGQMAMEADVKQRKAFLSLAKEAETGNVQAAKQINELSGILNSGNNHKIIVLHKIERPKQSKEDTADAR